MSLHRPCAPGREGAGSRRKRIWCFWELRPFEGCEGSRPGGYPISPSRHIRLAQPSGTGPPLINKSLVPPAAAAPGGNGSWCERGRERGACARALCAWGGCNQHWEPHRGPGQAEPLLRSSRSVWSCPKDAKPAPWPWLHDPGPRACVTQAGDGQKPSSYQVSQAPFPLPSCLSIFRASQSFPRALQDTISSLNNASSIVSPGTQAQFTQGPLGSLAGYQWVKAVAAGSPGVAVAALLPAQGPGQFPQWAP